MFYKYKESTRKFDESKMVSCYNLSAPPLIEEH